mmetsp:Transcript_30876/g.94963  ORF Transcript_30876/g.94963 Transcript_30876/m.94963 type:complete len:315 (+) Transcript_30876:89-1033(+)
MGTWRAEEASRLWAGSAGRNLDEREKRLDIAKKGYHSEGRALQNLVRLLFIALVRGSGLGGPTAVVLSGALRRADPVSPVSIHRHGKHVEYAWGWQRGRLFNRGCGVSVFLGAQFIADNMRRVQKFRDFVGRCGALGFRISTVDVLLVGAFVPPYPERGAVAEKTRHVETVTLVLGQVSKWRGEVGSRKFVAIGIDGNCCVGGGQHEEGDEHEEEDAEVPAGPFKDLQQYRDQVVCKQELAAMEEQVRCCRVEITYQKEGKVEFMKLQAWVECKGLDIAVGIAVKAIDGERKPGEGSRSAMEAEVQFMLDDLAQ